MPKKAKYALKYAGIMGLSHQKRSLEGRRGFDIFPRRVGSGDMVSTMNVLFTGKPGHTTPRHATAQHTT